MYDLGWEVRLTTPVENIKCSVDIFGVKSNRNEKLKQTKKLPGVEKEELISKQIKLRAYSLIYNK